MNKLGIGAIALVGCITLPGIVQAQQSAMDLEAFRSAALAKHNEYRAKHGVPRMELDNSLNEGSQQWAEELARRARDATQKGEPIPLSHSAVGGRGENIFYGSTTGEPLDGASLGSKGVEEWYNEIADYDFNNPGQRKSDSDATKPIGHFTQVVWKDSTKVGCGATTTNIDGGNYTFMVCQYSPQGNIRSRARYEGNVVRPQQN